MEKNKLIFKKLIIQNNKKRYSSSIPIKGPANKICRIINQEPIKMNSDIKYDVIEMESISSDLVSK